MKKTRNTISLALALLMVFTFIQPTIATNYEANSEANNAKITLDNEEERVATSLDLENKYVSTFDKELNLLTIQTYDKVTNELFNTQTIDLNQDGLGKNKLEEEASLPSTYAKSNSAYQNTFSNYEYSVTYGNPNKWELRIPSERMNKSENSSNKSNINNFRNKVESINSLEKKLAGALIGGGLLSVLTIIAATTPGALPSALAAAGVFGTAAFIAIDLKSAQNDAEYYYNRVKYN